MTQPTDLLERIEIDPQRMLGKPVIRGTRITVEILLEKLAAGESVEEILLDYPRLTRDKDFAELAFLRREAAAGILLLRLHRMATAQKADRLTEGVAELGDRLHGALVVVESHAARRRPLR